MEAVHVLHEETPVPEQFTAQPVKRRGRPKGSGTSRVSREQQQQELTPALASVLTISSVVLAYLAQRRLGGAAEALLMTDQEALAISVPAAKLLSKTSFYARYGRYIADSNEWAQMGMALGGYGMRVVGTIRTVAVSQQSETMRRAQATGEAGRYGPTGHVGGTADEEPIRATADSDEPIIIPPADTRYYGHRAAD